LLRIKKVLLKLYEKVKYRGREVVCQSEYKKRVTRYQIVEDLLDNVHELE